MANHYVRSAAAGAADGTTWADAFTTLVAAFAAGGAGDVFWVANDHAETQASVMTLAPPGTAAAPNQVLCVNTNVTEPPTALGTGATVTTTGNNVLDFGAGHAYYYGIAFSSTTGATASTTQFTSAVEAWVKLENCSYSIGNTGASSRLYIGVTSSTGDGQLFEMVNSSFGFGEDSQGIIIRALLRWKDTATPLIGTLPTTLFLSNDGPSGRAEMTNIDFSILGSGKSLINFAMDAFTIFRFLNCKLGASVAITIGSSFTQGGAEVSLINCDSADTNYRYHRAVYQGVITQETVIVKTGGASDGTTQVSQKMVSNAGAQFLAPLVSDPVMLWNESLSEITLTIPVITDNVTLTDAEAWIEVDYLGTSGFPLGVKITDRAADVFATPANQTTDVTSTWTTTGLSTPVKQELSVTFTPAEKGPIYVRVMLAKVSTTMYFDPKAVIS